MINDSCHLTVTIPAEKIEIFNKIIEGYDNLCIVTAIEPSRGELLLRMTPDTRPEVLKVLRHLPFPVQFVESTEI